MASIEGHARDQALLPPASIKDYVAADNPVRFIDAFVDDLDPGSAAFRRTPPKATGRPAYDPADLLKLYLYSDLRPAQRCSASCVKAAKDRSRPPIPTRA